VANRIVGRSHASTECTHRWTDRCDSPRRRSGKGRDLRRTRRHTGGFPTCTGTTSTEARSLHYKMATASRTASGSRSASPPTTTTTPVPSAQRRPGTTLTPEHPAARTSPPVMRIEVSALARQKREIRRVHVSEEVATQLRPDNASNHVAAQHLKNTATPAMHIRFRTFRGAGSG
jgi:hypothetical protein